MALVIHPLNLDEANAIVTQWHRHHKPTPGAKFSIGVVDDGRICGAAIIGRPVSKELDNGWTLEVNRCCTDGTRNACSFLYGAAWRVAKGLGYRRLLTYTLPEEGGASLRASGWQCVGLTGGGTWAQYRDRNHNPSADGKRKHRWEVSNGDFSTPRQKIAAATDARQTVLFAEGTAA